MDKALSRRPGTSGRGSIIDHRMSDEAKLASLRPVRPIQRREGAFRERPQDVQGGFLLT